MSNERCNQTCKRGDNLLIAITTLGAIIGLILGASLRAANPSADVIIWLGLPGDLYMASLKMVILPLIICSVIVASASMDPHSNGKISLVSLAYIFSTNALAMIIPLMVTYLAKPGDVKAVEIDYMVKEEGETVMETIDIFADLIRNLFPDNIVAACFEQSQTKYKTVMPVVGNMTEASNITHNGTIVKVVGSAKSSNVLGLMICCFILGMATSAIGEGGKPFLSFFDSANRVIMKTLSWLVWSTPIGVASLIAKSLLQAQALESVIHSLGLYSITIVGSLLFHSVLLVFGAHLFFLRLNPIKFFASIGTPAIVAGATGSTAVAIPETTRVLEDTFGVDRRVARFVVPLATTINRDGSAIFISCSCLFVSQMAGDEISGGALIVLWGLVTLLSMGIPSMPSSSIVVISIVLASLNKPTGLVGLLFAADWLLDRFRTVTNLISHMIGAMITDHITRGSLANVMIEVPQDEDEHEEEL